MSRLVANVLRRVLAREVRITVLRDETLSERRSGSGLIARFETPFALYRIFDGEELRRIVKTGRISGGVYSIPAERAYGASWGEDITQVIQWGNRQRGQRLGDDLFLAKIDAQGKTFYRMSMDEVPCDPNGPEEQPATMDGSKCSTGLGCSVVDVSFNEATYYRVGTTNHMEPISDSEIREYLTAKPQQSVELRPVSQVAMHGAILGQDVIVRMTQGSDKLYSQTWGVYIPQMGGREHAILMGAKTKEVAVKMAVKLIKSEQTYATLDLLPKSVRKKWESTYGKRKPEFYASTAAKIASRFVESKSYFQLGDIVLTGKYKNGRGKIVAFGQDKWGNPTIEVEPIPKGRKKNKVIGLYKVWRADVKENVLKQQQAEEAAAEGVAP